MKYNYNQIFSVFILISTLNFMDLHSQNLVVDDPTAEVGILRSATSTSRLNFENTNAPLLSSFKRGYIMSNNNDMVLGTSNNNQGGEIILRTFGNDRVTLAADGRLGIGKSPNVNTLLQVESQGVQTAWFTKQGTTDGNVLNISNESNGPNVNTGVSSSVNGTGAGGKIGVLGIVSGTGSFLRGISGQAPDAGHAGYFIGRTKSTKSLTIGEHPIAIAPEKGTIRYNDELDDFEGFDGAHWKSLTSNAANNYNSTGQTVTDIDGNTYRTIDINGQVWMRENLRTSRYSNGDMISEISDEVGFGATSQGAWCWYDNNAKFELTYGKLYNYRAVYDPRGLCPAEWHVATDSDWTDLKSGLPSNLEGGFLKENDEENWSATNLANNDSGFTAVPGGYRKLSGVPGFLNMNDQAVFWSDGEESSFPSFADVIELTYDSWLMVEAFVPSRHGNSVRCVEDD